MPHLPHGRPENRRHGDHQAEADGPGSRQPQGQRGRDRQPAPADARQRGEHLGQADQECVEPGRLRRSLDPVAAAAATPVNSKTAAVIKNPTPANAIPSNVFSIIFLKKSASGISGDVATAASSPTRTSSARRNPAGDVVGTQQPAQALGDGPAIMDQNRGRRPQMEDHVEEQVLLAGLGDARQPGEQILREQQVAVARDGQEFGDPLHDAQNQ